MTGVFTLLAVVVALLLALISFVQLLYLEALRLRAREQPALEFFKDTLEDKLGLKLERGALAFSLIKHSCILLLGLAFVGITIGGTALRWTSALEAAVFGLATMLVAAYIVPQWLYRKTNARWLLPAVPALRGLALAIRPLTSLFEFLQSLAALSDTTGQAEQNSNSSEELEALIEAGADEGLIEEGDRKLIQSVVAFGDKTVREVMTPRPKLVGIPEDSSLEDLRSLVIHEQYSRIPVYKESIDQIVGFVHVRDMFGLPYEERAARKVSELARPIPHVPETKPVHDLFRELQRDGTHMAIVVDEYGNTAGLATMEDIVEEIVGEIRDEHEPALDAIGDGEGAYIVSGSLDLDRLEDLLEFRPQEDTESTTVGGLVTEWLGRVPQAGEVIEREGIRIEVKAGDERRVAQVRISRCKQERNGEDGG